MSIRGNRQLPINEIYADELEESPGRIDRRREWRKRSKDGDERSKIDGMNWVSVELDGWGHSEGSIQIR
jgi:hypothetical protein